ncbi:hypothetical protein LTR78_006847 [Recurvomyces mirabilis]|uniref:C2H2-type domain-containing protein n=1 Tax=Recurvomyces mirabilis TaxID=574656 RepID=A0AAE0WKC0_9PEZI|nr:hypothetical protein LTR78_006847 [Recurvomyces mirabilis]KAK5153162.1 hypothetical protein LTS14_007807 [Recurvomyces mirabilis]
MSSHASSSIQQSRFLQYNHPTPAAVNFQGYQYRHPQQSPSAEHTNTSEHQLLDAAIISDAISQLQKSIQYTCMNNFTPDFRRQSHQQYIATSAASGYPYNSISAPNSSTDASNGYTAWSAYHSMSGPSAAATQSLIRGRSHQRTPSASTVGSNGPLSPYAQNYGNPIIANTDFDPNTSVYQYPDQTESFSKNLYLSDNGYMSTPYTPSIAAHTGGAHDAMKDFAIDHHNGEFASDLSASQSMSSRGRNSPATPPTGAVEIAQSGQYALPQNGEILAKEVIDDYGGLHFGDADYPQTNPNVQLWRTDSQAYQDELYNPPTTIHSHVPAPAPNKSASSFLSPHRNLMTERLQTANLARSQSPTSSVSRERSPFRDNSPLAPARNWQSPAQAVGGMGTAASIRQQQKEQAEQAELAQHIPQLNREATKTISPKDALLEYNEDQPSLFQDSVPAGYKQHNSGTEQWQSNFFGPTGTSFNALQAPPNFRATTSADGYSGPDPLAYQPLPPSDQGQLQNNSYLTTTYPVTKMESNPEFPAHLTTMESSISDNGPLLSSQDSIANTTSAPQRPADTRAATGTYTCTYHGCTQRFDSPGNLQKHKRDFHRSQHQHNRDTSVVSVAPSEEAASPATNHEGSDSASPSRSSGSPAPSASGMTSAALLARNSQAGPHKCTRINPSTNKPCNTIFSRPYDLTRHEDTIHNGRKQKVRCPMCREEKTFSRNDALTRHMRVVHPEVESFGKRKRE